MKKIVIDARELRGPGTGRYLERLLNYLQEIDNEHSYRILLKPKDIDTWEPTNRKFKKVVCPYKEFTIGEQIGLCKQLMKIKPDLVHFSMVQQPVLYRGKTVTTMHDLTTARFGNPSKNWLVFTIKQYVYKWVNRIVPHKSAAIITPSEFVKDDVARFAHVNSRKISVTYEAADKLTDESDPISELEGIQFIMYVGRPQPHKNLEKLIDAFAEVKKTHPKLHLVLAGKTDKLYKQLEGRVIDKKIEAVVFPGFVSDGKLRWLYENCQAYVFPSLSEGFGLPGLEAMVQRAPLISSNATCLPEIYGNAAEYFDPNDTDDMARAIKRVIDSPGRKEKLIKLGLKQVGKYSWKRMAKQTLDIYNEVLG